MHCNLMDRTSGGTFPSKGLVIEGYTLSEKVSSVKKSKNMADTPPSGFVAIGAAATPTMEVTG